MTPLIKYGQIVSTYMLLHKVYSKCRWLPMGWLVSLFWSRLKDHIHANPGVELQYQAIEAEKSRIKSLYAPITFISMKKVDAFALIEQLVNDRNQANNIYRKEYEKVVKQCVAEFKKLGFLILLNTHSEEWEVIH